MAKTATFDTILAFWFDEITPQQWFKKDESFDNLLRDRFGETVTAARSGALDIWADNATGCLALIIVLDQFTRNIYRDTPLAFSGDEMALALAMRCIQRGYLDTPNSDHRHFMLMPLMHSEDLAIQEMSIPLFEKHTSPMTVDFAIKHRDIIARFGRFPHRNTILGRPSSDEEIAFLEQPGSSF